MMNRIDEARDHLGAAIAQSLPSDDAIIMEHVRSAYELVKQECRERRAIRESDADVAPALKLYSATGAPIWQDLTPFGPMPAEAIALKFSDEVSDAEWITDADRLDALRSEGAPLAYVGRGAQ